MNANLLNQLANPKPAPMANIGSMIQGSQGIQMNEARIKEAGLKLEQMNSDQERQARVQRILQNTTGLKGQAMGVMALDPKLGTTLLNANTGMQNNLLARDQFNQQGLEKKEQESAELLQMQQARQVIDNYVKQKNLPDEITALLIQDPINAAEKIMEDEIAAMQPEKPTQGSFGYTSDAKGNILTFNKHTGEFEKSEHKAPAKTNSGTSVRFDENGQPIIDINGGAGIPGAPLEKPVRNKTGEKILNTANSMERLKIIRGDLKDEDFHQLIGFFGKAKAYVSQLKDRFASGANTAEDAEHLSKVNNVIQNSLTNLNFTLNELSGAAVSPQEFHRIAASLPNTGTLEAFDILTLNGDSPQSFVDKLDNATTQAEKALARYNYYLHRNSIDGSEVPTGDKWDDALDITAKDKSGNTQFDWAIQEMGDKLEAKYLKDYSPEEAKQMTRLEIMKRLGVQ